MIVLKDQFAHQPYYPWHIICEYDLIEVRSAIFEPVALIEEVLEFEVSYEELISEI